MGVLCVLAQDGTERVVSVHVLAGDALRIGRSPEVEISIPDPSVSRNHATLQRHGETWHITNVSEGNTLSVGGHRITSAPLSPGMVVALGTVRLRFEPEDPRERQTVPPQRAASPPPRAARPPPPQPVPKGKSVWPLFVSLLGLGLGAALLVMRLELASWSLAQWPQLVDVLPL